MTAKTIDQTTGLHASAPRKLRALRACGQVLGSVTEGIRAARECKTLTDRGVSASDAVRDVFDRVRAN